MQASKLAVLYSRLLAQLQYASTQFKTNGFTSVGYKGMARKHCQETLVEEIIDFT